MRKKKKTLTVESMFDNNLSYTQYVRRLTELSISMFKWTGLPPTVDERYLELALFGNGSAVFFKDDVVGFLALRCMLGGNFNVYDIPTDITAYASNGYNAHLTLDNSVPIFNNMLRTNSVDDVTVFAKRLYNIDRTIDVNVNAQKTPVLIKCTDNQRLTMQNMYMQYDGNTPFIFANDKFDAQALSVLKTDAPFNAPTLYELKEKIWNEALTYLGISNITYNKKERLISSEVINNMGGVIASRYSRLQMRKQACEKINAMFGLNVNCEYREDSGANDEMNEGETDE